MFKGVQKDILKEMDRALSHAKELDTQIDNLLAKNKIKRDKLVSDLEVIRLSNI